jgi:hypothetical protein
MIDPMAHSITAQTRVTSLRCLSARAQIALGACACGAATAFLFAVDPHQHGVYPQCLLYQTTGLYCAGCGATRALHALLHGRILESLHDNVLFIAFLPLLIYAAGSYALKAWDKNAWPAIPLDGTHIMRRGIAFLLLMVAFMVLRNLPGAPFDWLKPL